MGWAFLPQKNESDTITILSSLGDAVNAKRGNELRIAHRSSEQGTNISRRLGTHLMTHWAGA